VACKYSSVLGQTCLQGIFYLFDKFNARKEVHTEVNKGPIDAFWLIFLLFKYKHVVIEKLLQFFIGEVDTQLFETVGLYRYK